MSMIDVFPSRCHQQLTAVAACSHEGCAEDVDQDMQAGSYSLGVFTIALVHGKKHPVVLIPITCTGDGESNVDEQYERIRIGRQTDS